MSKPKNERAEQSYALGSQLRYVHTRRMRVLKKRGVAFRPVLTKPGMWSWLRPIVSESSPPEAYGRWSESVFLKVE